MTSEILTRFRGEGVASALDRAFEEVLVQVANHYKQEYPGKHQSNWAVENANRKRLEKKQQNGSPEVELAEDDITFAWAGLAVRDYKMFKDLKKENLRDNMTNLELVLNMLAEASTAEISKQERPETFVANRQVARRGGGVAGRARQELEKQTGRPVISHGRLLSTKKKN